jgi:hypothetical protein
VLLSIQLLQTKTGDFIVSGKLVALGQMFSDTPVFLPILIPFPRM